MGLIKGDTRSVDYNSHMPRKPQFQFHFPLGVIKGDIGAHIKLALSPALLRLPAAEIA